MKIAFIGCGAMGGALASGMIAKKGIKAGDVCVYDKDEEKLKEFCEKTCAVKAASEAEAASLADVIFICVKPGITGSVSRKIKNEARGKYIVSIAAGVTVSSYLDVLGRDAKVVRLIPNLPARKGFGLTGAFYYNFDDSRKDVRVRETVNALLKTVGEVVEVRQEKMIDEMIALTSSSPAYFCMMIEAMADFGVQAGFTREEALKMVEQAMMGTSAYLLSEAKHPGALKDEVCSPGGTTIAAVTSLEKSGFRKSVLEAMEKCRSKAVRSEGYV